MPQKKSLKMYTACPVDWTLFSTRIFLIELIVKNSVPLIWSTECKLSKFTFTEKRLLRKSFLIIGSNRLKRYVKILAALTNQNFAIRGAVPYTNAHSNTHVLMCLWNCFFKIQHSNSLLKELNQFFLLLYYHWVFP